MISDRPGSAVGAATPPGLIEANSNIIGHGGTALKKYRTLRGLVAGPLHRFQAEKFPISDHALPSTISELRRDGFEILSTRITVAGFGGRPAHLAEYRLADESRAKALQLLQGHR